VYGNHPIIDPTELDATGSVTLYRQNGSYGDFESTDFRDGTILNKWIGVGPQSILTADPGDPAYNWTVPNFDMPLFVP
jgi:hypothetical protein